MSFRVVGDKPVYRNIIPQKKKKEIIPSETKKTPLSKSKITKKFTVGSDTLIYDNETGLWKIQKNPT